MAGELVFTVSRLNEYAARVLSNDPRLRSIKVSGEISGFKRHSSGHLYFNLKDADAVVSCVMFRSASASLKLEPRDGLLVTVHGSVTIYPRDGKYQLYVDGMRASGEGELFRRFLLLKEKLGAEGVFSNERPIPALPRMIGIATSASGAALHDIVTVTRRRFPNMNLLLAPCSVQGEGAPREIAAAIRALQRFPECDVMIVGRGGGSYEDLNCFNDESVARAIFASRVPVVSAVGHETDFTIADFAADLRAPTPSAAAELCCPVYSEEIGAVEDAAASILGVMREKLSAARSDLLRLTGSSAMANPSHSIKLMRERLASIAERTDVIAKTAMISAEGKLSATIERLRALSPGEALNRGYAMVLSGDGRVLKNVTELEKDMRIEVVMAGGTASAEVTEINPNGEHNG